MADQTLRTDLSDLVRRRRAELGLGLRPFTERCIDPEPHSEEPFKYGWVSKIEKADPTVAVPSKSWMRALAVGLQVPVRVVQEAVAAQFLDLVPDAVWSRDHSTSITVARMDELTPEERAELAEMVELWTRRKGNGRQ